jgi:uncharacterized protein
MTLDTIVIYHAFCADGMGSAWAAHTVIGAGAEYKAASYDDPLPSLDLFRMRHVYIVDFSYPASFIREIGLVALSVAVLDHHKTAQKELVGQVFPRGVVVEFDMDRSGAGMTWDYLHPGEPRPRMIDYIEDRDLWRWKLPNTHEVNAYIGLFPISPSSYAQLAKELENPEMFRQIVESGKLLVQQQDRIVTKISRLAFERTLHSPAGAKRVAFINTSTLISEVGNLILEKNPHLDFVAGWFDKGGVDLVRETVRVWSLRAANRFDVSDLAKKFGGGGHPNAAGFTSSTSFMLNEIP